MWLKPHLRSDTIDKGHLKVIWQGVLGLGTRGAFGPCGLPLRSYPVSVTSSSVCITFSHKQRLCATYVSTKLITSIEWTRWIGLRDRYGKCGMGEGVCVFICVGWVDLDLMQFEVIYSFVTFYYRHKKEPRWKAIKVFWVSVANLLAICRNTWSENSSVKEKDKKK